MWRLRLICGHRKVAWQFGVTGLKQILGTDAAQHVLSTTDNRDVWRHFPVTCRFNRVACGFA
jgi:hypothetical protein